MIESHLELLNIRIRGHDTMFWSQLREDDLNISVCLIILDPDRWKSMGEGIETTLPGDGQVVSYVLVIRWSRCEVMGPSYYDEELTMRYKI